MTWDSFQTVLQEKAPVIDGECGATLGRPKTKILGEPGRCGVARPKRANQAKGSRQSKYYKLSKRKCRAEGHRDDIAGNRFGCGPCKMILSSSPHAAGLYMHGKKYESTGRFEKERPESGLAVSPIGDRNRNRSYIIACENLLRNFRAQSVPRSQHGSHRDYQRPSSRTGQARLGNSRIERPSTRSSAQTSAFGFRNCRT
jgi:hypothetical protein